MMLTLTQQAEAIGHEVALTDYWPTTGIRRGTKYAHPVKNLRWALGCSCGWGVQNVDGLSEAIRRGRAHMQAALDGQSEGDRE